MKTVNRLLWGFALSFPIFAVAEVSKPLDAIAKYVERSAPATVLSLNHSTLSAQIAAKVEQVDVRVSQQVKQGQRLMLLECDDYLLQQQAAQAGLDAATSRAALAKNQRDRTKQLFAKNLVSKQQWEAQDTELLAADANVRQAQVALKQAALSVQRCEVKAPFDGVVTQRLASVGQLASVGTPLIAVVDQSSLEVSAHVASSDAKMFPYIDVFIFDSGSTVRVDVHNIGTVVDPNTRSQEVRLLLQKPSVLAGTAGKLRWQDPRPLIPQKYIREHEGKLGVWLNNEGIAEFVVLPNASPGRDVLVELALDTLIVTEGASALTVGQAL